ncbi:TRC40/GET3/ArsA family transport-energizing ATPase [Nakamurella sp. YIM 132087]|uniref:TRC40/GET3/ArsA family transport-energizing ATPase n=1 Tax=Nakamurella alba TaxID=2665158 RepID=A0A7K1FTA7_9ACTN|nr:ArsA family ATPase [Nakamurella alba]MTD17368.1 TRC40/GET3/ArsA family transport-energizing ATPase [Nakamurella alba]
MGGTTAPRVVLHTGKGGVGKSTVAAMTAVAAAGHGHRVLLLSTDPAHSAADVLDLPLRADPTPVPGVPGLCAAQVDVRGRFEQAWSAVRGYLVGVLAAQGIGEVQADELTVVPGAEEVVALLELKRHLDSGEHDLVVVDCAPTGETLRLLAVPETLAFYGSRLLGGPARLLRGLAAGLAGLTGGSRSGPSGEVRDALADLLGDLAAVRDLLTDAARGATRIVLTPERVVVAEARRLRTALALHGYPVDGIVVNRVLPDGPHGELVSGWQRSQAAGLEQVTESFADLPQHRVPWAAAEPVGVPALTALAAQVFAGEDPAAPRATAPGPRTTEAPGGWELRWSLPLAERGQVHLGRSGDDLVVTVGPHRRRLTLPSLLQRCRTDGARFEGDDLVVRFVPDPERWPEALAPVAEMVAGR